MPAGTLSEIATIWEGFLAAEIGRRRPVAPYLFSFRPQSRRCGEMRRMGRYGWGEQSLGFAHRQCRKRLNNLIV
jgi:hypothetical protein